jgi:hypothetical protein
MTFLDKLLAQGIIAGLALGIYALNFYVFHWSQGVSALIAALTFSCSYHEVGSW